MRSKRRSAMREFVYRIRDLPADVLAAYVAGTRPCNPTLREELAALCRAEQARRTTVVA